MEEQTIVHAPVMPREVIEGLALKAGGLYIDCTLGEGGHSELMLATEPGCRVLALEQDAAIAAIARARMAPYGDRFRVIETNFEALAEIAAREQLEPVAGILLDLGISSFHYEKSGRGFSFQRDEPLDMRLGPAARASAADIVNEYEENELVRIFREYGEERFSGRIARAIVTARTQAPIVSSLKLAGIVAAAVPGKFAHDRIHPATRVFQALRIEVNRELEVLTTVLGGTIDLLAPGGRLCVISFHSLEDRIVKQFLRANEPHCVCPPHALRCTCGLPGRLRAVQRKALVAGPEEVADNPRSRSAKLRVAERLADAG